ncbi:hypothetical protein SDC9_70704 [bioreactor metagenome]|uniref:Anti-sigma factor RsgI-like middle domain-containing protein n=1 Tax=bioreactor metagenome TaxID=1076179 RepID=A0A644YCG7_9ZZZZ
MLKNKKIATVIAAAALALGITGVAYSYTAPAKYISFDINPSVELVTNAFDKVIDANALNEDGIKILESLDLENKDVKEAVDLLTQSAIDNGYLQENLQNEILVTVATDDADEAVKTQNELGEVVKEELKEENLDKTPVTTENINMERHKEAARLGISPGKMNLIQKLEAVKPGIKYEDYSKKPVKDIMKEIKDIRKENKEATAAVEELDKEQATEANVIEDATKVQDETTIVKSEEDKDVAKVKENKSESKEEKDKKDKEEKTNNGNHGNGNNGNGKGNNGQGKGTNK